MDVAAPRESDPLLTLTVVEELVERLRAASLGPVVTFPVLVRSITALTVEVGTTPPTQLPGVSQEPPVGAAVVFHVIVDIRVRSSRPSNRSLRHFDRLRPKSRR